MKLEIDHATQNPAKFLQDNDEILQVVEKIGKLTRCQLSERITVFTAVFSEGSKEVFLNVYNDNYDGFLKDVEKVFKSLDFNAKQGDVKCTR